MRKWNYFLTLLVGATLTLTSCIDTTEPAGIEAMRTSKSEWLKAKAAYENALVQLQLVEVEKEKVAVEVAKIGLELEKLNLKKQAVLDSLEIVKAISDNQVHISNNDSALAQNALAIARLEQALANLADEQEAYELEREKQLLVLYEEIAIAEQNYLQTVTNLKIAMLTYKDEVMQDKLEEYEGELDGYNSQLNTKRAELLTAQLAKWKYDNNKAMFVEGLPVEKAQIEKDIELQKSLIAKLDSLNKLNISGDITALYAQIDAYDDELEALEEKEKEMLKELEAMKTLDPKVAEEIAALKVEIAKLLEEYTEINKKKQEEYTLTIAKADVDEAMVQTLADALSSMQGTPAFDDAFEVEQDPMTYMNTYTMIADFNMEQDLETIVEDSYNGAYYMVTELIVNAYQQEYVDAYHAVTRDYSVSAYQLFNNEGKVKDQYLAKIEVAKDRFNKEDEATYNALKEDFDTTYANWGEAYAAYKVAAAKFQGYEDYTPEFDAVWAAVEAYKEAKKDTLTYAVDKDKAGEAALALYNTINDFIVMKKAVDGLSYDFTEDYDSVYVKGAAKQDTIALTNFNDLVANYWYDEDAFMQSVGSKLPQYYFYDDTKKVAAAENGGALPEFLVLSEKLFGDGWSSIASLDDIFEPILKDGKYVVPESIIEDKNWGLALYDEYTYANELRENADKYDAVLNGVDKWLALIEKLNAGKEAAEEALDAINDELQANLDKDQEIDDKIIELNTLNLDEEAIWAKEFECYKIFGTETGHAYDNNEFDNKNPYIYATPALDVTTEASVINDAKQLVNDAITDATGTYNYWYYDPVNKTMVQESSANLASLIEAAEDYLAELEEDLEQINIVIAAVKEYDAYAGKWEDFFANSGLELGNTYETEIAECEAAIAAIEEDIKTVNAAIAALIAAYEAGELDVELPGEGA